MDHVSVRSGKELSHLVRFRSGPYMAAVLDNAIEVYHGSTNPDLRFVQRDRPTHLTDELALALPYTGHWTELREGRTPTLYTVRIEAETKLIVRRMPLDLEDIADGTAYRMLEGAGIHIRIWNVGRLGIVRRQEINSDTLQALFKD